jgi:hypothetical protein
MKWRNVDMVKDLIEIVKSFLEIILKGSEVNAKFLGKGQIQIPIEILAVDRSPLSETEIKSLKTLKWVSKLAGVLLVLIATWTSWQLSFISHIIIYIIGALITIGCAFASVAFFSMEPNNIRAPRATLLGKANCYDDFFDAILTSLAFEGWESTDWSKETGCIKVQKSEDYFSSPYEMNLQISQMLDNSYKLNIESINSDKKKRPAEIYANSRNVYKFLTRVQALARNSFKEKTPAKELS